MDRDQDHPPESEE